MLSVHLLPGWVNSRPSTRARSHFSFLSLGATEGGGGWCMRRMVSKNPEIPSHEDDTSWRLLTWWIIHPSRPFFLFFVCRIKVSRNPITSFVEFRLFPELYKNRQYSCSLSNPPFSFIHTHITRSKALFYCMCVWLGYNMDPPKGST